MVNKKRVVVYTLRLMKSIALFLVLLLSAYASPTGPSSYPYISGDTWRHFVNFRLSDVESFRPEQVERGDAIFVEQDSLDEFIDAYAPHIRVPYVLVTANCDRGGDEPMPGKYERLLDDPHLFAWFTQNMDRADHPKLHPIPIGLANRKWSWGKIEYYDLKIPEARSRIRTGWLYVNFQIGSNRKVRQPVWDYFASHPMGSMVHLTPFKAHLAYMQELPNYRFVVSPPGNGLDTHRTWEALLLGSYPIVISSSLNALYDDLPVLVIGSWDELTPEILRAKYEEFQSKTWTLEKLYFPYYFSQLEAIQKELRNGQ